MVLFTVEENGIGINPEKADKLFQKFYQIDTGPTRKHAGTGLGLVICRGIIEAHGGKIWIDNACKTCHRSLYCSSLTDDGLLSNDHHP
jgi:signal transduction histidine kinase